MLPLVAAALAAPILLQDGSVPGGGVGQQVFAGADTDGDGVPEVLSTGKTVWVGWDVSDLSRVSSVYRRTITSTTGADFVSLGPLEEGADIGLLYGYGYAELITPTPSDSLRETLLPALELARESGFHADGGRMLDGRYVSLLRYEPVGATYATLKAWMASEGFVGCWTAPAGFALDFTLLRDFPARGQERVVVASLTSSGTVLHAWAPSFSGARSGGGCVDVDFTSGREIIAEFPRPAAQVVFAPATAGAHGWFAFADTTGSLHVQAFTGTGMPAGTMRSFASDYARRDISRATGPALLAADVAGDSAPDLLLADPLRTRSGTVSLWVARTARDGTVSFPDDPDWTWSGQTAGDGFGASIAAMPDLDGDEKAELLVGATLADASAGRVELILSGTDGVDVDRDGTPDTVDCAPEDPEVYPGARGYADADGDGFGDPSTPAAMRCESSEGWSPHPSDCDDSDASSYPGAPAWPDRDGDGFGDALATPVDFACEDAETSALQAGDCNDSSAAISPQAFEACNFLDDDCDGVVDEGVGVEGFPDGDGDGHGGIGVAAVRACDLAGLSADAGDCDDANPAIHPGAVELPGDGLDNDCDAGELEMAWARGGCGCAGTPTPRGYGPGLLALLAIARRGRKRA